MSKQERRAGQNISNSHTENWQSGHPPSPSDGHGDWQNQNGDRPHLSIIKTEREQQKNRQINPKK